MPSLQIWKTDPDRILCSPVIMLITAVQASMEVQVSDQKLIRNSGPFVLKLAAGHLSPAGGVTLYPSSKLAHLRFCNCEIFKPLNTLCNFI